MSKYHHLIKQFLKFCIGTLGVLFLFLVALAFTRVPFDVHRWLGDDDTELKLAPETIIMLGGSGMPSESNLIRLYYTKELGRAFPESKIIICHPDDSVVLRQMTDYLEAFGILSNRIFTGSHGLNTREQVMELTGVYPGIASESSIVVTSPENMYRTIRTFRKLGFKSISGVSAFENAMFVDLGYNHRKLGGKTYVPDVSGNLELRYNFWNYLKLEITCLREFVAIGYYKINGWI